MGDTGKVVEALNKQVANFTVLYMKLHNYHWFVKGSHFFTLHEKFEELYGEVADSMDEFAERLLAIGGKPVATLKKALEIATIHEAEGDLEADQMVQSVMDDFTVIIKELEEGIEAANEAGDDSTADLFTELHTNLQKHNWMLGAYLGK